VTEEQEIMLKNQLAIMRALYSLTQGEAMLPLNEQIKATERVLNYSRRVARGGAA
jgi:hypothetical protein